LGNILVGQRAFAVYLGRRCSSRIIAVLEGGIMTRSKDDPTAERASQPGGTSRGPASEIDQTAGRSPVEGPSGGGRREEISWKSPTQEAIAKRAYDIYLERGGEDGHESEHWLRAERELIEHGQ
jgi:Protein of unknown function (DUF2934)